VPRSCAGTSVSIILWLREDRSNVEFLRQHEGEEMYHPTSAGYRPEWSQDEAADSPLALGPQIRVEVIAEAWFDRARAAPQPKRGKPFLVR